MRAKLVILQMHSTAVSFLIPKKRKKNYIVSWIVNLLSFCLLKQSWLQCIETLKSGLSIDIYLILSFTALNRNYRHLFADLTGPWGFSEHVGNWLRCISILRSVCSAIDAVYWELCTFAHTLRDEVKWRCIWNSGVCSCFLCCLLRWMLAKWTRP